MKSLWITNVLMCLTALPKQVIALIVHHLFAVLVCGGECQRLIYSYVYP